MLKEKIRKDFEEAMTSVMDKIFFDVRMLATVDILSWEESGRIINDAVNEAYIKYKTMNSRDYAKACIDDMVQVFENGNSNC